MPFKKNSPGCICCASGFTAGRGYLRGAVRFTYNGARTSINMNPAFGTTVEPIGYDIERKYILAERVDNKEIWMYNPVTNASVGKLWDSPADICDSDNRPTTINYIHSWGFAYGLSFDSVANEDNITVWDSSGNHFHGPYYIGLQSGAGGASATLANMTIKSNGDLYYTGVGQNGYGVINMDFRVNPIVGGKYALPIYVNDDIDYPRSIGFTTQETFAVKTPSFTNIANAVFMYCTSIFSDGTNVYLSIPKQTSTSSGSIQEGIYVLNEAGESADRVLSHDDVTDSIDNVFIGMHYNPLKDRFEGGVAINEFSAATTIYWTTLSETGKYIAFATDVVDTLGELFGITAPPNIEATWDDL